MFIFLYLIASYAQTYVGTTGCAALLSSAACTASAVAGLGYCYWEGTYIIILISTCYTLPCYLIDEVAACRSSASYPIGGASSYCDSLETFSLQFDNVCCDKSEGQMNYAFVRFTKTTDGSATQETGGTAVTALTTTDSATMFKLYTVNPWLVSSGSFQTQLTNILSAYITLQSPLITLSNSHPFYLERTVYQSLQLLRVIQIYIQEYIFYQTTAVATQTAVRAAILPKIWSVALIALARMTRFQPNYYQTNYYFINFAIIPYSRLTLTMQGQLHSTQIDWSGYSYASNGFLTVYSFPPEQFGVRNAYSDVICLRPIITTPATYAAGEAYFDTAFSSATAALYITWYWTDTSITVVQANLGLYSFPNSALESGITQVSGVTFNCDLGAKKCVSSAITTAFPAAGINYYVSTGIGVAADKNKLQCRLALKTWTYATATTGTCA